MAQRSLNKVQLIGNLTRDPELRYTPQGTAVCTLGLATNRTWATESGEKREEVEFHRLVAWNKLAELCSQLLFKGRKIFAEGRLQTRQWTAQDGTPRQTTEIVMSDMIILDSRRQPGEETSGVTVPAEVIGEPAATPTPTPTRTPTPATDDKSAKGTGKKKKEEAPKTEESQPEEVKAEDIPF